MLDNMMRRLGLLSKVDFSHPSKGMALCDLFDDALLDKAIEESGIPESVRPGIRSLFFGPGSSENMAKGRLAPEAAAACAIAFMAEADPKAWIMPANSDACRALASIWRVLASDARTRADAAGRVLDFRTGQILSTVFELRALALSNWENPREGLASGMRPSGESVVIDAGEDCQYMEEKLRFHLENSANISGIETVGRLGYEQLGRFILMHSAAAGNPARALELASAMPSRTRVLLFKNSSFSEKSYRTVANLWLSDIPYTRGRTTFPEWGEEFFACGHANGWTLSERQRQALVDHVARDTKAFDGMLQMVSYIPDSVEIPEVLSVFMSQEKDPRMSTQAVPCLPIRFARGQMWLDMAKKLVANKDACTGDIFDRLGSPTVVNLVGLKPSDVTFLVQHKSDDVRAAGLAVMSVLGRLRAHRVLPIKPSRAATHSHPGSR